MDFLTALHVSASGLSAQRTRVNLATSNLANAESTRGPDGQPYKRLDPVFEAVALHPAMAGAGLEVPAMPGRASANDAIGVRVTEVKADETPGRRVYNPDHPDADATGYVTLPNVNPIHEVVNLMSASRGYDANATALETLKTMAQRAIDISR